MRTGALLCFLFACALAMPQFKVKLGVTDEDGTSRLSKSLAFPDQLSKTIKLKSSEKLSLSFEFESAVPSEVFLALKPVGEQAGNMFSSTVVIPCSGKACSISLDSKYTALVDALNPKLEYAVTIYLSPVEDNPSFVYSIGLIKPGFASHEILIPDFGLPKPEIQHIFRADEKLPSPTISVAFSGFVLAPWIILVLFWFSLGVNFKALFSSKSQFVYGSLFLSGLASLVGLFYLYFTVLNLFQFLAGIVVIGLPIFVVGRKALVIRACNKA